MPLYQTVCNTCDERPAFFRKVADRNNLPPCTCGGLLSRVLTAPAVVTDIAPFLSPATGRVINSRTQLRDDLERSGSIMNEPGLKADITRNKQAADDKLFAPIEAAIDRKVTDLVNTRQLEA